MNTGKVCVISGATSGIGKVVAEQMLAKAYRLAVVGRSTEKGKTLLEEFKSIHPTADVQYFTADLSSVSAVKSAAAEILQTYDVIDVLINNAGGVFSAFELSEDGVEKTMANNHLNYFVLTLSLMAGLKASSDARIISVSSATHYRVKLDMESFTQKKNYNVLRAYAQSKLANVMFSYALARRLEGSNVSAIAIHPGVVATPIGGKARSAFHRMVWKIFTWLKTKDSPEKAAKTYVFLATDVKARKYHGEYLHAGVHQKSAELSYDEALQEKLWDWSVSVADIDYNGT